MNFGKFTKYLKKTKFSPKKNFKTEVITHQTQNTSHINTKPPKTLFSGGLTINILEFYNSKAAFMLPFIRISTGFSRASFTATKNPTDSRPSMIR